MNIFVLGCIVGFLTATPLGPIGMLCLRKTLKKGKVDGWMAGIGIALAYGIAAYVSAMGVIGVIKEEQLILRIIGGLLLGFFALRNMRYTPYDTNLPKKTRGKLGPFVSFFLLTIANPITFITFSAIFAGIGLCHGHVYVSTALLAACGIAIGASGFWLMLGEILDHFRSVSSDKTLRVIHHCSTAIITLAALASIISVSLC